VGWVCCPSRSARGIIGAGFRAIPAVPRFDFLKHAKPLIAQPE
jgi:hypothetical protein